MKRYIPEGSYKKARSTNGSEFVELVSRTPYKGFYIEDSRGNFYGGKTPQEDGPELLRVVNSGELLKKVGLGLFTLVGGFFLAKPTKSQRDDGVLQRYFLQDRNNKKITEVDKETYLQAQKELVNTNFTQVDWIIKGPAEDKMFGKYPYEGAESKNKKTIQALESQMKGISTFITDYKYLVEDPAATQKPQLTSETFIQKDNTTQLQDDRKANFDYKSDSIFPGPSILGTEVPEPQPLQTSWTFVSSSQLDWPADEFGYTLYQGAITDTDDGYTSTPIILPTVFSINNQESFNLYVSTNGYFTLGAGNTSYTPDLSNPAGAAANESDLLLSPGSILDDGSEAGLWSKSFSNGNINSISLLVYSGFFNNGAGPTASTPSSYILNFYRDAVYQYIETRLRYNNFPGQSGPYNDPSVYQTASTTTKVWRGDYQGLNWEYLGEGVVV